MPIPAVNIFEQGSQLVKITSICDDYLNCQMTGMDAGGALAKKSVHVSRAPGLRRMDYEGASVVEWEYKDINARTKLIGGEINEIYPPYTIGEEIYITKKIADPLDDLGSYNWACIGAHAGGGWTEQRYEELTGAGVPINTAKFFVDENRVGRTWQEANASSSECLTISDPCIGELAGGDGPGYEFYMGCKQGHDVINGGTQHIHKVKFVGDCFTGELNGEEAGTDNLWEKLINTMWKASDGDCYTVMQGPATNAAGDHSPIDAGAGCPSCSAPGHYLPWEKESWYMAETDTYGFPTVSGIIQPWEAGGECGFYNGVSESMFSACREADFSVPAGPPPHDHGDCGEAGTASPVDGYCEKEICINAADGSVLCGVIMFKPSCRECVGSTGPDGTGPDGTAPDGTGPGGTHPDGTGEDGTGPDGTYPDGTYPDGTYPDGTHPSGFEGCQPECKFVYDKDDWVEGQVVWMPVTWRCYVCDDPIEANDPSNSSYPPALGYGWSDCDCDGGSTGGGGLSDCS